MGPCALLTAVTLFASGVLCTQITEMSLRSPFAIGFSLFLVFSHHVGTRQRFGLTIGTLLLSSAGRVHSPRTPFLILPTIRLPSLLLARYRLLGRTSSCRVLDLVLPSLHVTQGRDTAPSGTGSAPLSQARTLSESLRTTSTVQDSSDTTR